MSKLISVILTGGKSSRMGYENKSFLKFNNKNFIEILTNSLKDKSYEIIINAKWRTGALERHLRSLTSYSLAASRYLCLIPQERLLDPHLHG